ncbi:MAG: type II toxin-antitoxin system RelB/DinJ family antitoxin [Patescibacteria group bacterium]
MKTTISFKTDERVKKEAQKLAKEMGLTLSKVLNVLLRQFISDKEIHVSLKPSKKEKAKIKK